MTASLALSEQLSQATDTLRIGLFTESFIPVQNGVTTSVQTLIRGLRNQNHHVCVFAPAHQEQQGHEINVLRFPSFVSSFNREYPLALPFVPRIALATHFSRLRFDIVHTHTPFVLGLTGANLAVRRGVPLVSTFHTLYNQYSHYVPILPGTLTQGLLEYYLPWYYNRCTEIICPSQVAANALREQGVESPIEIIPTGIPLPNPDDINVSARECVRHRLGLSAETPVMLYAGRLSREKRVDWLLDVFARVVVSQPEARLLIAGAGSCGDELQAKVEELKLEGKVLFLGAVPREEMDSLYAASDVFCFPSPSETQGLVIGEARAAGTPCVVMDAGGAPETVTDGEDGFCIPADNQELFAYRVSQILSDASLRAYLSTNALKNAVKFTPEVMIQRVVSVYERAKSRHPVDPGLFSELDWETVGRALTDYINK